jgi:hypothetical protein
LISDRNVIQVGEHKVGIAVDADVGQMQNFGVAPLAVNGLLEEARGHHLRPSSVGYEVRNRARRYIVPVHYL